MPPGRDASVSQGFSPICLRLRSREQRLAWESAAAECGMKLSAFVRMCVDAEIGRRAEARELEERRRAEGPLAELLERYAG